MYEKKKYYKKKASKKISKTGKKNKTFEKKVKIVMDKYIEPTVSDSITYDHADFYTFNTLTDALPTVVNLIPPELSNPGSINIQGNEITLKSLKLKMLLEYPQTEKESTLTLANVKGRIVIAKLKDSIDPPALADFQTMYKDGKTTNSITNNFFENFLELNRDAWDVKRTIPFSLNSSAETYQPPSGLGQYKYVSLDLAKYLPKKFKYSMEGTTTVFHLQNAGLYMFILAGASVESPAYDTIKLVNSMTFHAEYYDV